MAQVTIPTAGTAATSLNPTTAWFLTHVTGNTDANRILLRDVLNPGNVAVENVMAADDTLIFGDASDGAGKIKRALRRDFLDPMTLPAKTTPVAADVVLLGDSADTGNKVKQVTVRNLQRFPTFTTAGRPAANTAGAGATYYDTTLSKPGWSDGTVWRDAAGVAI